MKRLVLLLVLAGCGSSPPPACPSCPTGQRCDPQVGVCVGWRDPLLDALPVDGATDAGAPD